MGIRLFVVCVLGLFFANAVNAAPPACDAGAEGTIVYNKDQKLVQFCNGTNWIGMVAKIGGAGDTLSDLSCASGEVPEWNGAAWICGAGGTGLWTDSGNGYLTYTGTDTGIKVQAITGMSAPTNTLADLGCANDEVLKWDGDSWECAADGGGLTALQGQDDAGSCTLAKDGLIRYRTSGNPKWEYCDGGTTSWLPFRLPQCQNDGTGDCTLSALRSADDPQFIASKIQCGENILGVTGTYGSGSSGAFNFTDVTNAALSTLTTASAITISGIPGGCPGEVTVSGQGSPQISIAGGAWGTSGMINNGETLAVRLTSSGSTATAHVATIEVGSTQDTWSVATVGSDTTPNAFDFTPNVTNAALSTLTTASSVTITGINVGTTVSVSGTGSPQISINGGAWVTSGTITNGQTLAVRLTSSASFNTAHTATVDVGGVTDAWSVTTLAADTTPNAFDFTPNVTNAALSTLTTASSITISGINTTTPVSVSGTGSPQISINGGAWVTSGNITNGQTLAVRLTSSASTNTAHTATVDVGGVTDAWSVTTAPPSDVQTFTASGTWTKPAWATTGTVNVKCVGGGGGGGRGTSTRSPKGGGGGGYSDENLSAALLPGTVAVTIGVGGTGATGNPGDGGAGGNSTFGALVMASGGGGGEGTGSSDGPGLGGTGTTENGGDGGDDVVPVLPENTTNSGAGGGGGRNSTLQPGGTSTNAGDGGDACDGCVGTNNGASPGGGGGAQRGTGAGGNGGSGECVITTTAADPGVTLLASDTNIVNSSGTSNTHTGIDIGTASATRLVVAMITARHGSNSGTITSVTIGGINATLLRADNAHNGGTTLTAIYGAIVPTGTTANIVANFSTTLHGSALTAASFDGFTGININSQNGSTLTSSSNNISATGITTQAGGLKLAVCGSKAATDTTLTNATERADYQWTASAAETHAAAWNIHSTQQTNQTISCTFGSSENRLAISAVSLTP